MLKEILKPFQMPSQILKENPIDNTNRKNIAKNKQRVKNLNGTLLKLWFIMSEWKKQVFFVLVMVLISSGLGLLGPLCVGFGIDNYIVASNQKGLITLLFSLAIIYILHSISVWLQNVLMIQISQNTIYKLRSKLFEHIHLLPLSFFDKRQHGELMSRLSNDIENVSNTLNSSIIQIFSSVLTLIGTVSIMLWLSPLLTLLTFCVVPFLYFGIKFITKYTAKLYKQQQYKMGLLNGFAEETLSGQQIIKVFSQEEKVISEFKIKNEAICEVGFWAQTIAGFIPKLMNVLNFLSYTFIACIGGVLILYEQGGVTIGVILIFLEYSRQFTRPLNELANQWNSLLSAIAGAERVFEIIDEKTERQDKGSSTELTSMQGEVIFSDVSFSYDQEHGEVIKHISFLANPGETIAIVGPTGAGKTTIINLISCFYDLFEGDILIDGHRMVDLKRSSIRRHMAFVLQDSYLFEGSIKENIRYSRLNASDGEVIEAAKLAGAHSFIEDLSEGYETKLKQDGSGISQGQKQLLAIARAILANPSILILDEATSSIDTVTEMTIQKSIKKLMNGRTSFVIAHRLNTIQNADKILVLKEGKLIQQGSHDQLIKVDGFYRELYESQFSYS
ncbi:ABC transporter ATP-binding protein [Chengkuizengella axinellae]|uniref:ABC transporter ATP-binding protein n=1 Tax=Chengkuizengella axinellae TaxID=3064388 RepID=A0ABT9IWA6_9BACL|nr:ABC transporter ATP-binding protein [Chengkuizengella sp. 2205SS18-9]MDP5273538.1 ABC transporter ATP-binding protein [Chengkuizengella sp. 2205SS18-9]